MAMPTGAWTIAQLDRLPDDGNKYELVDEELFVTPAPSPSHESLALRIRGLLDPFLVVEILSSTTRRRDHEQKRAFYLRSGVAEYWIVDGKRRTIRVVTPHADDIVTSTGLTWHPAGTNDALTLDVAAPFREALGPID